MHLATEDNASANALCDPMSDAIQRARSSIGDFFKALRLPRRGQTNFQIQAVFQDGDQREQIWMSSLDFNTRPATGIVSTRPRIKSIAYRKRVPFRPDQMSDWMYNDNGRLVGGFTMRVARRAGSKRDGIIGRLKRRLIM